MNGKQKLGLLFIVLAVGVLIYWAAMGAHIFTSTEHLVETKDELFGTVSQQWVKQYVPGLDYLGPVAGVLVVLGGFMLFKGKRSRQLVT